MSAVKSNKWEQMNRTSCPRKPNRVITLGWKGEIKGDVKVCVWRGGGGVCPTSDTHARKNMHTQRRKEKEKPYCPFITRWVKGQIWGQPIIWPLSTRFKTEKEICVNVCVCVNVSRRHIDFVTHLTNLHLTTVKHPCWFSFLNVLLELLFCCRLQAFTSQMRPITV